MTYHFRVGNKFQTSDEKALNKSFNFEVWSTSDLTSAFGVFYISSLRCPGTKLPDGRPASKRLNFHVASINDLFRRMQNPSVWISEYGIFRWDNNFSLFVSKYLSHDDLCGILTFTSVVHPYFQVARVATLSQRLASQHPWEKITAPNFQTQSEKVRKGHTCSSGK